jgi:NAD+ kinase
MVEPAKVRRVGIIAKPRREEVASVVPGLLEWLRRRGLEAFYDCETADCLEGAASGLPREQIPGKADLLLVLGGDGTLLAAARLLDGHNVPILPVNLGGLGFLTSVTLDELYPILEQVLAGQHRISERILLDTHVVREEKTVCRHRALNDAVLNKTALARVIDLDLHLNDGYVCSYKADGLIISTPTGSTAYSLSAGGPIVFPVVDAFVITPICPHSLANRSLVVPDTFTMEVDCRAGEEPVFLTVDGQVGVELKLGDRVLLKKAETKIRLVRPPRKTYFELLRNKLKWGQR